MARPRRKASHSWQRRQGAGPARCAPPELSCRLKEGRSSRRAIVLREWGVEGEKVGHVRGRLKTSCGSERLQL